MSKRIRTSVLGAFLLLQGAAASAQLDPAVFTDRRTNNTTTQKEFENRRLSTMSDAAKLRSRANAIASCVARRAGDNAGKYVGGAIVGDPDYKHISDVLTHRFSECAGETSATVGAISGALVEQLLLKQAPTLPDRVTDVSDDAARSFFGDLKGLVTLENVAGCLTVYSPGLVYKLIGTEVGSPEEAAALQAVYQQTPECKMPAPPASVDALHQRGALATALYKWTNPKT